MHKPTSQLTGSSNQCSQASRATSKPTSHAAVYSASTPRSRPLEVGGQSFAAARFGEVHAAPILVDDVFDDDVVPVHAGQVVVAVHIPTRDEPGTVPPKKVVTAFSAVVTRLSRHRDHQVVVRIAVVI